MNRLLSGTVAATLLLALGACGAEESPAATGEAADNGATLTLWTRAATESVSKAYAAAYNATHKNQVQVTAYPNETHRTRALGDGALAFLAKPYDEQSLVDCIKLAIAA